MIVTLPNDIKIGLRPAERPDLPFIYHSWCKQCRTHQPFDKFDAEEFRDHKSSVIDALVERSSTLVAHDASDEEIMHGYIVFECPRVLHFVYVKGNFRGYGIGKALMLSAFGELGEFPVYVTHKAQSFKKFQEIWKLRFNPYKVLT